MKNGYEAEGGTRGGIRARKRSCGARCMKEGMKE